MPHEEIDPHAAHARQQEGWSYVDVRTPEEFAEGHPQGAVNVPVIMFTPGGAELNAEFIRAVSSLFPKDAPLLMGCKSGGRSARACEMLSAAGYMRLANVGGGFHGSPTTPGWSASGLPTASDGQTWDTVRKQLR
ncbi:MAG: rhodanese-like domain-containing protein [Myxococcota bacterium]